MKLTDFMWQFADTIDSIGYKIGMVLIVSPYVYDVIGVFYGRGFWELNIATTGYIVQVVGIVIMLATRIVRRMFR